MADADVVIVENPNIPATTQFLTITQGQAPLGPTPPTEQTPEPVRSFIIESSNAGPTTDQGLDHPQATTVQGPNTVLTIIEQYFDPQTGIMLYYYLCFSLYDNFFF